MGPHGERELSTAEQLKAAQLLIEAREIMEEFVERVNRGEVKSQYTYGRMCDWLAKADR